jgi:hypothetical protein
MGDFIEVEYQPRKKIIIHEIMKVNIDELIASQALGAHIGDVVPPLFWVDGILLKFIGIAQTEAVVREMLEGNVHWDNVVFALMPRYERQKELGNNIIVPIIDVSANNAFKKVAKFLKEVKLD